MAARRWIAHGDTRIMMGTIDLILALQVPQGLLENVEGFSIRDAENELSGLELLTKKLEKDSYHVGVDQHLSQCLAHMHQTKVGRTCM